MANLLRVLIVEDSEDDAQLMLRQLRSGGYDPKCERVDTASAMSGALDRERWDVILCDYKMPHFSAPAALKLIQDRQIDIPFIIVSGSIGEETAVSVMKSGAHDYVMKDKLAKLTVAIEKEIRETRTRGEKKQAEEALRKSEERFRALAEQSSDIIILVNREGIITYENPAIEKILGLRAAERIGANVFERIHPDDLKLVADAFKTLADNTNAPMQRSELRIRHMDGSWRVFEAVGANLVNNNVIESVIINLRDITERKLAEKILSESELKLRTIFESVTEAVFVFDMNGVIQEINEAACEMHGYAYSELIGTSAKNLVAPESHHQFESYLQTVAKGQSFSAEAKDIRKDGTIFDIEARGGPIVWNGEIHLLGVVRDITERKNAEHQIKERMKELRAFYSLSEITEREGITLDELYEEFVNSLPESWQYPEVACARIVIGQSEFRTKNFAESAWMQSAPIKVNGVIVGNIEVGYLEERPKEYEGPFLREERLLIDTVAERLGLITDHKRAVEELLKSRALLYETERTGKIGGWVFDAETLNQTWTEEIFNILEINLSGGEPKVPEGVEFIAPEFRPLANHALKRAIENGEPYDQEWEVITAKGNRKWVHAVATAYQENGKTKRVSGFMQDITERRRLMIELIESQQEQMRTKDRFISHVSHEFRSPLASIYQFTTILLDGLAGEIIPEQREYLDIILRNVHQLRSMVDDLLEINRAAAGKLAINPRYVVPAELIKDVVDTFRLFSTKAMWLSADIAGNLPPVLADPARVREVLINLLDNAMKFTPEHGSIIVRAEVYSQDPNFVCVKVSDTGCGISREEIQKIFEYLYQVEKAIDSGRKGLGLGLSICKELISRQGGRIWAESEPGHGTTFFFTIPVFSLSRLLEPIMTDANAAAGGMSVVTVEILPVEKRTLTKNDESALQEAWDAARGCIIPNRDVLLPLMPSAGQGMIFCAAMWAGKSEAESLLRKIEERLGRCQSLGNTGLKPAIFISVLDIPAEMARKPFKQVVKKVVAKVGEQTKVSFFEKGLE